MLEIRDISKKYHEFSLEGINFSVEDGSYTVLLGPSGAGKTQVLEIIAGLIRQDSGSIFVDDTDIGNRIVKDRPIGLVFQDLAVFPHLSVEKNIAYSLQVKNIGASAKQEMVRKVAEDLEIAHLLRRKPDTLSGGELQRVALARTLVRKPRYLLLDEPLSSLDVQLRQELISILKNLHRNGQTILHVTHDFEESIILASHVAVINQGRIIQTGITDEVFHRPGSEFVARFTGVKNYFPAKLITDQATQWAKLNNGKKIRVVTSEPDGEGYVLIPGKEIILSCERLESSAANQWQGKVKEVLNAPGSYEILIDAGIPVYARITKESLEHLCLESGREVWLSFKATGVRFVRGGS